MLTSDLVRVRRKEGALIPLFLTGEARARLLDAARYYDETLEAFVGKTREEVSGALEALAISARDRVAALGVRKVLEDRGVFEVREGVDAEAVRKEVFTEAARVHRELDVKGSFDREAVLKEVAERRGVPVASLEADLYADLRGSELLKSYESLSPEETIDRYNVGLAQAMLLRATRVSVRLEGEDPARVRQVFRAARFHGLMHVVRAEGDGAWVIDLDGPFSLFDAVQRYGLKLAMFLPTVLACPSFQLRADVLWGKERTPATFALGPEHKLVSYAAEPPRTTPELDAFREAFDRLASEWTVKPSDHIFALAGEVACVPDLVFVSATTGEEVFLEAFGFWSRASVWNRVELLRKGTPIPLILAVGKQLRVSEEVLGEDDAGEVYVYKTTMSARAVLERLRARSAGEPVGGRRRKGLKPPSA